MRRLASWTLVGLVLGLAMEGGRLSRADSPDNGQVQRTPPEEAKAVDAIKKLGGEVIVDGRTVSSPIQVYLCGSKFTDTDLKTLASYLEKLPHLAYVVLTDTSVTDAGLEHLKESAPTSGGWTCVTQRWALGSSISRAWPRFKGST